MLPERPASVSCLYRCLLSVQVPTDEVERRLSGVADLPRTFISSFSRSGNGDDGAPCADLNTNNTFATAAHDTGALIHTFSQKIYERQNKHTPASRYGSVEGSL
ncbi:hypothetical protein E2C01_042546 [Portunus trituberculatus]|uniref:Uncharacterized protein n=1 Tax=Portunus trituberculatus TaxID=210409 RepID=A0A5B7FUZ0_PORTR|nr:hypothetical protein [Portunus trituberculatus]